MGAERARQLLCLCLVLASFAGGARLGLGGNRLVLARSTVEAARAGLGVVLAGRTILAVVIAIVALYICDVCEQELAARACVTLWVTGCICACDGVLAARAVAASTACTAQPHTRLAVRVQSASASLEASEDRVGMYWPLGHALQEVCSCWSWNSPATQVEQAMFWPAAALYWPFLHFKQEAPLE